MSAWSPLKQGFRSGHTLNMLYFHDKLTLQNKQLQNLSSKKHKAFVFHSWDSTDLGWTLSFGFYLGLVCVWVQFLSSFLDQYPSQAQVCFKCLLYNTSAKASHMTKSKNKEQRKTLWPPSGPGKGMNV